MRVEMRPVLNPSQIPEAITYLERETRGEQVGTGRKVRQIEEVYFGNSDQVHENLRMLVQAWGDQPAIRQILFYHYLMKEPVLQELLIRWIYPKFQRGLFLWDEMELRGYLREMGLTNSEQVRSILQLEKALDEARIFSGKGASRYLEYQRPTVEAVAYALYAEYGEGFCQGRRFYLQNPPVEHICQHAAFPAYFLLDPRMIPMILEACRIKDYISLEARGGLRQYALIFPDLMGLIEYMVEGGQR